MLLLLMTGIGLHAQKGKDFAVSSPDGHIRVKIITSPQLQWSVTYDAQQVLAPSDIALTLGNGMVWGMEAKPAVPKEEHADGKFAAHFYKKDSITDKYNELRLSWKGSHGVIFRVYDDGAAYRFFSDGKDSIVVRSERAEFNFDKDYRVLLPYVREPRLEGDQFETSFEDLYDDTKLSAIYKDSPSQLFCRCWSICMNGMKAVITEADLENYPGDVRAKESGERSFFKRGFMRLLPGKRRPMAGIHQH